MTVGIGVIAITAIVVGYFVFQKEEVVASWWNEDWAYRKSIQVTNNTGDQANVYISLTMDTTSTSTFQTDCGDIRFTDNNGQLLQYYIDSGCGSTSTIIYVAYETFPAGEQTIYMYYGNASADNGFAVAAGSGSVTQANLRLSIATSTAFVDFSAANTLTQFSGYRLAIRDSANKKITGYIKAAGTGETYGSEIATNGDFSSGSSGWVLQSGWDVVDQGGGDYQGVATSSSSYLYRTDGTVLECGALYKNTGVVTNYTSGSVRIYICPTAGCPNSPLISSTGTILQYVTRPYIGSGSGWYYGFTSSNSATLKVDNYSLKQVLTPSATGVTITSASTGSTYNWKSEESGFNRNDSSDYTYVVYPMPFTTEASDYGIGSLGSEETGPGPVAYWRLDEGQGTTAYDSTMNNLNGTLSASPANPIWKTESECVVGKCLDFDGSNDELSLGVGTISNKINGRSAVSISAWIQRGEISGEDDFFEVKINSTNTGVVGWVRSTDNNQLTIGGRSSIADGGIQQAKSTSAIPQGTWTHVAGVLDFANDQIKVYINGKLEKTQAVNFSQSVYTKGTPSSPDRIGGEPNYKFNGLIDEVKIYPYARSAAQIASEYNAGLAGMATNNGAAAAIGGDSPKWMTDGLVGWWKMDEASSTLVRDYSGNSNNGTLTNAQETDTAHSDSSSTTIVALSGASLSNTNDAYNGMIIYFSGGAGCAIATGTERTITDYASSTTKSFTVANLVNEPDNCNFEIRHQTGGKFGNGLGFEDQDDYVSVVATSTLNTLTFTLSAWFYDKGESGNTSVIISRGHVNNWYLDFDWENKINFWVRDKSDKINNLSSLSTLQRNTWNHVLVSYDDISKTMTIYLNGKLNSAKRLSDNIKTLGIENIHIGAYLNTGLFMNGIIDDVRIYNRALTPSEVEGLSEWGPGPLAYWKYDEGSDATAYDSSGNGYNGLIINAPAWANGKFGNAIQAQENQGNNNFMYLETFDNDIFRRAGDEARSFTIGAWAKPEGTQSGSWRIIAGRYGCNSGILASATQFSFSIGGGCLGTKIITYTPPIMNSWYYLSAVYDNYSMKFYIHGNLVGTATYSSSETFPSIDTDRFFIGGGAAKAADWYNYYMYNGLIDDVRIYNYARTQKQILEDMNGGNPSGANATRPRATAAYYKFDEGYGSSTQDSSINNQDLTISTTTAWTSSGKFGRALDFEKDYSMYAYTADSAALSITGDLTMAAWIKPESVTAGTLFNIAGKWDTANSSYLLSLYGDELRMYIDESTNYKTTNSANLTANNWYHVAGVYRATSSPGVTLYINGNEQSGTVNGTIPYSIGNDTGRFFIGAEEWGAFGMLNFFDGIIDELKIYPYALTANQVAIDMNQGKAMAMGGPCGTLTGTTGQALEYCVPGDTAQCDPPVGEWKFDEKKGSIAHDTSGNGFDGSFVGAPTWTRGQFGSALSFGGTGNYVSVPDNAALRPGTGDFTASFWVKIPFSKTGGWPTLYTKGLGTTAPAHTWGFMGYSTSNNRVNFAQSSDAGGSFDVTMNTLALSDGWHLITARRSGTTTQLYQDGLYVNQDTSAGSDLSSASAIKIGGSFYLIGQIDQPMYWNYARTQVQIAWDYNRGKPIGHWKLDECQGTRILDWSENKNNGTLSLGASGQTSAGTCVSNANTAWYNGRNGKFKGSLNFDGDDYITMIDNSALEPLSAMSISAWIKRARIGTREIFIGKGDAINHSTNQYEVEIDESNRPVFYISKGSSGSWLTVQDMKISDITSWHHILMTWNGTIMRAYLDGIQSINTNTATGTMNNTDYNFSIGRWGTFNGYYFQGQIDDVRIYNYALTAEQVKQVMNDNSAIKFGN